MNGTLDTGDSAVLIVYFDSTNPSGAWINDTGPGTGTCSSVSCHGGYSVDWYGTGVAGCAACHFAQMGSRRPVIGANGDFGANPAMLSHHVTGTADPTPAQCQACHDMSQHMGGTVWLKQADTGASIAFDPAVPSTLEPFCLSCHDTDGAGSTFISAGTPTSPFNDGSTMGETPHRASIEIKDAWSKTYGHKQKGLTCIGNGTPDTGCHGNGHGTGFVGLLAKNLSLPTAKTNWYNVADEPDYDLCWG
jgi:predicted CxxxxCH...CXXCH cytochrome family protein